MERSNRAAAPSALSPSSALSSSSGLSPSFGLSPPSALSGTDLARRLAELCGEERNVQVEFLLHLDVFDRRRGWAEAGYGSLWAYCLEVLHLRESSAGRRIAVMKILRRFPALEAPLRDGRLSLSTADELGPVLTEANLADLVVRAAFLSTNETRRLVASIQPRAAPADGVRRLPRSAPGAFADGIAGAVGSVAASGAGSAAVGTIAPAATGAVRTASAGGAGSAAVGTIAPAATDAVRPASAGGAGSAAVGTVAPAATDAVRPASANVAGAIAASGGSEAPPRDPRSGQAEVPPTSPGAAANAGSAAGPGFELAPTPSVRPASRPELRPVTGDTFSLRVTLDAETNAELQRLVSLLSHRTSGDLAAVVKEAIRCALEKHGKRKGAVAPDRTRAARPGFESLDPRKIPMDVRRTVWERDGGRCAWTSADGKRCGSTWKLEFGHVTPVALGGKATVEGIRIECRTHNVQEAIRVFGARCMAPFLGESTPDVGSHGT